jgi:hypothetical protein
MSEQYWKDRADALERALQTLEHAGRMQHEVWGASQKLVNALLEARAALTQQEPDRLEDQGYEPRGEPLADQPADAGEPERSVSLRQQISEAQETVAAWPKWMTKSAKVHEPSCCARTREAELERCAAAIRSNRRTVSGHRETWINAGLEEAEHAIRRTGDTP